MAAADDDLALTYPIPRDMQLPPTPPEDYSDENNKARLQTPPMQTLQQLLTPDNTPPGMVLHPPRPLLSRDPSSSRANSFSTAREQQSREFLSVVDEAGSQAGEDSSSEEESEVNGKGNAVEKEPWLNIPGAFRSTPSSTDSRNTVISNRSVSTPSTGSSDSRVRPKQYLDPESSPSTGSSRNIAREKRYRLDTESPLDREKTYVDGSTSCAQSSRSSGDEEEEVEEEEEDDDDDDDDDEEEEEDDDDDDKEDSSSSQQDGVDGQDSEQYSHYHETEEDWGNHVSYMSADGENESATGQERSFGSARGSPASSRLSGHGRRVGNNGAPHPKGINNPPYTLLSNKAAEQGLLKRGSNESSRQRSDGTPSPSIAAQKRRQKPTIPDIDGARDDATPGASEARRLNWLRQHAGTLASPDIPAEFLAAPPRNSNDLVYKHIQQANMDRFDAIKDGKAVEAVVIPSEDARNRHLRHVTKRQSLRSMSDNNSSCVPSNPPKREPTLRHKKPLAPQKVSEPGSPESPTTTRSASGSHSLRHEKRPLKGTGRPLQSNESSPAPAHAKQSPSLRQKPAIASQGVPKLRHASLPIHLSPDASQASPTSVDSKDGQRRRAHALRRSSREYRIENKNSKAEKVHANIPEPKAEHKDHSTIIETTTFASPHLLGLGAHHRDRSLGTPFSVSANSDRTEMEVCEAQNVAFYPHSNESLLVVQHRSKPDKRDRGELEVLSTALKGGRSTKSKEGTRMPPVRSESPPRSLPAIAVNGKNIHTVESPLINPREAPMPPVINFIPATPSHEDDEQELAPIGAVEEDDTPSTPQRRGSLAKRARRYSEVVVRPLFGRTLVTRSHNIRPSPTASEKRDERLHPNWVPNSFWQDEDDDEDDYYDEPEDSFERLPAGGDTSEHPRAKFPRNMSVRMPGFRGSGGFLLGNSLGMDRHGTNKRRPHVASPSTNGSAQQTTKPAVRRVASLDSMSTRATGDGRIFSIPGTHTRLQYVGFKPIKDKIKKRRQSKEDAARERRRAELKDQIGMRIVHDA